MEASSLLVICCCIGLARPGVVRFYQDLSTGREYRASSTCGAEGPEEFKGRFPGIAEEDSLVCDASVPERSYPPEHLSDADSGGGGVLEQGRTWWLAGNGVEDVSLTLDLDGFYFLRAVRASFLSPTPAAAVVEASQDFGTTFHPLRYYSQDCEMDFDLPDTPLGGGGGGGGLRPDQLVCTSNYSGGIDGILFYDPLSASGESEAESYLHTLSLTNVRVRFLRFGSDADSTSSYYALYDLEVQGACLCGQNIAFPELSLPNNLSCPCSPSLEPPFSCPPPTAGALCRSCAPGFYLAPSGDCQPCGCDPVGTQEGGTCDPVRGQCDCRPGVRGRRCDTCPEGYLGPSEHTYTPCIRCFCNGFASSGGCGPEEGWYQAQVANGFESEEEGAGFTSPGAVAYNTGFLQVSSESSSSQAVLSFPPSYLGDKRTAFGQRISLTLDLPMLPEEITGSEVRAYLEVTGFVSDVEPQLVLEFEVKVDAASTGGPQMTQVVFSVTQSEVYRVPYFQRRRLARERDVRRALANIRFLRLRVQFPKEVMPSQRVFRLHSSSLDFATPNNGSGHLSGPAPLLPLQEVGYVERCSCPVSRTGSLCQGCAEGYTFDPSFGGEFAHCVKCFCNFRSLSCDPVSGVCSNCSANTRGQHCETCVDGFDRALPISFLPCDRCADGFFDAGNGSCVACQCDPQGSLSQSCDITTGDCPCLAGVGGAKCDRCQNLTLTTFPNCDRCDECTDQWRDRISPFRARVSNVTSFIAGLNLTNQALVVDVPEFQELLRLARDIRRTLGGSEVEVLIANTSSTHSLVCFLVSEVQSLLSRAQSLEQRLVVSENTSSVILADLSLLTATLSSLRRDLANISTILSSVDVPLNGSRLLQLSRTALERADSAAELVRVNFTSVLMEVRSAVEEFVSANASAVETRNEALDIRVDDIRMRVDQIRSFLDRASLQLCGKGGGSGFGSGENSLMMTSPSSSATSCGDECGGIGCETCGVGEGCGGLAAGARQALNDSQRALEVADSLLLQLRSDLSELTDLLDRVRDADSAAQGFQESANQIRDLAVAIELELRNFVTLIRTELNLTRIDVNEIGRNVNATLDLQLNLLPGQFFELLSEINATIDMFFSRINNMTEVDLRRRVLEALSTALEARALADETASRYAFLQGRLTELRGELDQANAAANTTSSVLGRALNSLDSSGMLLEASRNRLNASRSSLRALGRELGRLEAQIERNELEIVVARNLTEVAAETANETEAIGQETVESFNVLEEGVNTKLAVSERDLAAALNVTNRTCRLQEITQAQLLQLENLVRIEQSLVTQQEEIRDDIERVVNEIEVLEANIRTHITRNTICLTSITGNKKRRRRSS